MFPFSASTAWLHLLFLIVVVSAFGCFINLSTYDIHTIGPFIILVLKGMRRTGAHRVLECKIEGMRRGACLTDARRASMQIFFKAIHLSKSVFCRNKLDNCI